MMLRELCQLLGMLLRSRAANQRSLQHREGLLRFQRAVRQSVHSLLSLCCLGCAGAERGYFSIDFACPVLCDCWRGCGVQLQDCFKLGFTGVLNCPPCKSYMAKCGPYFHSHSQNVSSCMSSFEAVQTSLLHDQTIVPQQKIVRCATYSNTTDARVLLALQSWLQQDQRLLAEPAHPKLLALM